MSNTLGSEPLHLLGVSLGTRAADIGEGLCCWGRNIIVGWVYQLSVATIFLCYKALQRELKQLSISLALESAG